jgi:hypothetical protein
MFFFIDILTSRAMNNVLYGSVVAFSLLFGSPKNKNKYFCNDYLNNNYIKKVLIQVQELLYQLFHVPKNIIII